MKVFKKILLATTLVATVASGALSMSACHLETAHPQVTMEVGYGESTYTLTFKLYRNMYPQTVKHFIELVENKFYDNTIVHNYKSNDIFGGGYAYDANTEDSGDYATSFSRTAMGGYLAENSLEQKYLDLFKAGAFTPSVFVDGVDINNYKPEQALPTLYGEFSSNKHTVSKNGLTDGKGALKMYYQANSSCNELVTIKTSKDGSQRDSIQYKYNCATSLFAVQMTGGTTVKTGSYCTFGMITNESVLDDLRNAIEDDLTTATARDVEINTMDAFESNRMTVNYTVTETPIIIKVVKVKKY